MLDLSPAELDTSEALAKAATEGPWISRWDDVSDGPQSEQLVIEAPEAWREPTDKMVVGVIWHDGPNAACSRENAAFIADARAVVPRLIAEVRRLRVENATLRATGGRRVPPAIAPIYDDVFHEMVAAIDKL